MRNTQWYLTAKKIHRLLVIFILITGLFMMITGFFLYEGQYLFFDSVMIRYLHNQLSIIFTIALGIMMFTGLYLFIFPYLPQKKTQEK